VGKPSKPNGFTVTGTDSSDILRLPSGATILNTTVDGRRGNDTLDLSTYASAGVYVNIEYGMAKAKSVVSDQPFTGVFSASSPVGTTRVEGSIRNVENVIGTSGNDFLFVHTLAGVPKVMDGGAGNDVLNSLGGSATLIGGTGNDWLVSYWENNVLIGGVSDGDLTVSDGVRDNFYLGSAPTIMDFEVGTDHLLLELQSGQSATSMYAPGAIVWLSEAAGSTLYVNGVREVTLANVDLATAQSILFGVVVSPINNVVKGGAGDDMLWAGGHTTVTRVVVGSDNGDDIVINFDLALDTLAFEDGVMPIWSNTIINGATALVGTFEGGSVTFQGMSMDDVASIMIDGSRGTLAATEDPIPSAWSVPSDFL
jgi:Ca2+-binding RTX toxin-like protein